MAEVTVNLECDLEPCRQCTLTLALKADDPLLPSQKGGIGDGDGGAGRGFFST